MPSRHARQASLFTARRPRRPIRGSCGSDGAWFVDFEGIAELPADKAEAAWREGAAMPLEQLASNALEEPLLTAVAGESENG
jgi:hypothetical protein